MRTLSHDAFARQSVVKSEPVPANGSTCQWCGQVQIDRKERKRLFQFGTSRDDSNRIDWHSGLFCSKDCHDDYHS